MVESGLITDEAVGEAEFPQVQAGARNYLNPFTRGRFRLTIKTSNAWRITRSMPNKDGAVSLVYMSGQVQENLQSGNIQSSVEQLLRGCSPREVVIGDPREIFIKTVYQDMNGTFNLLCAILRDRRHRYQQGVPGFRPLSTGLRKEMEASITATLESATVMGSWWLDHADGRVNVADWLRDACNDISQERLKNNID